MLIESWYGTVIECINTTKYPWHIQRRSRKLRLLNLEYSSNIAVVYLSKNYLLVQWRWKEIYELLCCLIAYLLYWFCLYRQPLSYRVRLLLILNSAFSSSASALLLLLFILLSFYFSAHCRQCRCRCNTLHWACDLPYTTNIGEKRKPKKEKLHFPTVSFSWDVCWNVWVCAWPEPNRSEAYNNNIKRRRKTRCEKRKKERRANNDWHRECENEEYCRLSKQIYIYIYMCPGRA